MKCGEAHQDLLGTKQHERSLARSAVSLYLLRVAGSARRGGAAESRQGYMQKSAFKKCLLIRVASRKLGSRLLDWQGWMQVVLCVL